MEMQLVTQVHGGTYQILSNARPAKYYIVNSRIEVYSRFLSTYFTKSEHVRHFHLQFLETPTGAMPTQQVSSLGY